MIVEDHQIAYRNIASKYYNFLPEEIDIAIKDFDTILSDHGLNFGGIIFFSIISDPTAEVMTAKLFIGIEENQFNIPKDEEVGFSSYFFINRMLMTRIIGEFETASQVEYWALIDYIKKHELIQKTPIFVEIKRSHEGQTYVEMSVGVL